jgi:hypothetical protein
MIDQKWHYYSLFFELRVMDRSVILLKKSEGYVQIWMSIRKEMISFFASDLTQLPYRMSHSCVIFLANGLLVMKFKKYISPLQGIEPWSSVRQTVILPLYYSGLDILVSVFISFLSEGYWTRHVWEMLVWKVWPCHNLSQQHTLLFWFSHTCVAQSYSEIGGSSLSVIISISNWVCFVSTSSGIPYSAMYPAFITVFSRWTMVRIVRSMNVSRKICWIISAVFEFTRAVASSISKISPRFRMALPTFHCHVEDHPFILLCHTWSSTSNKVAGRSVWEFHSSSAYDT